MSYRSTTAAFDIVREENNLNKSWFAVEVLRDKAPVAVINLRAQGFGTFNPQIFKVVSQFGKSVRRLRPLFPGYIFVSFDLSDGRWRSIRSTRGVKRFAGPPGLVPQPVQQAVMDTLLERCPDEVLQTNLVDLEPGKQVRLSDCAFSGALAQVHELDDAGRVRVLISILGAERVISVPRAAVQPALL